MLRPWEIRVLDALEIARLRWLNRDREAEPDVVDDGQSAVEWLTKTFG